MRLKHDNTMNLKPGGSLFAVNSSGRVFALCRDNAAWQEFEYLGIEFKRVAAAKNAIWAIGGDHQIYVYVYGIEVPIRKGFRSVIEEVAHEKIIKCTCGV
jgi:hypothetical protein